MNAKLNLLARFKSAPAVSVSLQAKAYHATAFSRDSVWKRFVNLIGTALANDDRINPKKILERRYLYFALTALHCRQLRERYPDADVSDLKKQAMEDLHKQKVDESSNLALRVEMQNLLVPQVMDILNCFDAVDETLSIPSDASSSEDFFSHLDWEGLKDILQREEDDASTLLDKANLLVLTKPDANRTIDFLQTKLGAVQTLLHFHGLRAHPPALPVDGIDYFGVPFDSAHDEESHRTKTIKMYQTVNICRSALVRESLGYSLLCLRSTIAGAGRGAFVDGEGATAGSLVAFQPGDVWPKEHLLTDSPDVIDHFADGDDDCQTSLRFDDYVLDSRTSPVTILTREGTMNPWALGHMVNHPSPGILPNCQSLMLDFTQKMNMKDLVRYIPNSYARPPGWQSRYLDPELVVMHSMCLLARRDIQNEEIFYDYRLQSNETPEWYQSVIYGDEFLDREQVVFFRDDWRK